LENTESTYKVPLTTITDIIPHSGADKLEIAQVYGFQVIVKKDQYKKGDKIIYVPVDSIITPQLEYHLFPEGSKIKLDKGRIKQIRIRGLASQGMLISVEDVQKVYNFTPDTLEEDLKEKLNIIKYEPPKPNFQSNLGGGQKRNKPLENSNFHKYNGLTNIKWCPFMFKEGELVIYQEKLHGCLDANTKITMADGTTEKIKDIVEDKVTKNILGMDDKGRVVETPITNHFNNGTNGDWLKITYSKSGAEKGKSFGVIKATTNHKFFVKGEYIPAEFLKVGDKLTYKRKDSLELSYIQMEVLKGKMLGDGCLSNKSVSFGHKKEHEEYLDYTLNMLGDVAGNKQKNVISGYGTEMCRARSISHCSINEYFSKWFYENDKIVPFGLNLSPISLAFWYMDDGNLATNEGQEDRASFATNGFNETSINNLLISLEKMGIKGVKYESKGWRIRLNADEAEKMFVLIAPYIPNCMKYKLPERYRDFPTFEIGSKCTYKTSLVEQEILNIEKWDKVINKENQNKYDIETGTHNFFANGVLVHNSNARFGLVPFEANTLLDKIKKLFRLAPKYEFVYGSNNVQLQKRKGYSGFYGENVYSSVFEKIEAHKKVKPNEIIYGELIGEGIQKNYDYGHKGEHHFVLFDVKIIKEDGTQSWLNPNEVMTYAMERGFDFVPNLYVGPYSDLEHVKRFTVGDSVYCSEQKVREGIVVKSFDNYVDERGNKRALKAISEKYLDKEQTDFH
jgi:tRNA-binding EMAP/Myf-like protein